MDKLKEFIAHARKKGMDHSTIRVLLLSAGWKERDIAEAMTEETLDMPIPLPVDSGGARDAFFHLLTFVSLYTTVISLIVLFFNYLNALLPDPAFETYPGDISGMLSSIRWSIAAIIVSFPLFLWITRILVREMNAHAEKAVSGVRRWLTYLTLFVTAAALMGDLITLVFYLLDGEVTPRFLCKVFVVLLLAGMTFTYYFLSLRMEPQHARTIGLHKKFGIAAGLVVLIAIGWGMWLAGSPLTQREKQFDDMRVEDLRAISNAIFNIAYAPASQTPGAPSTIPFPSKPVLPVPKTLDEVAAQALNQRLKLTDPETNTPYIYTVKSDTQYSLCATFSFPRNLNSDLGWNHPAGYYCFNEDVTGVIK